VPATVTFEDTVQVFNVGPASVGVYGTPAGLALAVERYGSLPLSELVAPAAALAREGVEVTAEQAYVFFLLDAILRSTPECEALFAPGGKLLAEGDVHRNPELADTLERFGAEGPAPFYEGEIAAAAVATLEPQGGMLMAADLAAYEAAIRRPVRVHYRGRDMVTNPPPSAGGILIGYALALLEREQPPPSVAAIVAAMEAAQSERTPEFLQGLSEEGFEQSFMSSKLGSTTHISVIDGDGLACSVTCSNGEGAGIIVPATGIHLNNMMGEQDLNPLGFHHHPPGRRMPSMMAPTMVLREGAPELVLGSGGSNRIRSAILQTIVAVIDRGLTVEDAVRAPRVHFEDEIVYCEPGVETSELESQGRALARFKALNLFFGGVQAVARNFETGAFAGGGDPRRGGSVEVL
jgi:gamma-glutamyltranspeptidase/glutathione hydrolase